MRQAVGAILLACAFVGCAGKRSAVPRENDLVAARAAWLAEWRKGRTYELAEEFLKLYGGDTVREATEIVHTGTEQALWTGHEAHVEMPLAEIKGILGKFDYVVGYELRCELKVSPEDESDACEHDAFLGVEDIASQGIGFTADMTPVGVRAMRLIPMPLGGTYSPGKDTAPSPPIMEVKCRPRYSRELRPEYVVTDREGNRTDMLFTYLVFDVDGAEAKAWWASTTHPANVHLEPEREYTFVLKRWAETFAGECTLVRISDGDAVIFERDPKSY